MLKNPSAAARPWKAGEGSLGDARLLTAETAGVVEVSSGIRSSDLSLVISAAASADLSADPSAGSSGRTSAGVSAGTRRAPNIRGGPGPSELWRQGRNGPNVTETPPTGPVAGATAGAGHPAGRLRA